jgi:hypothetical protein
MRTTPCPMGLGVGEEQDGDKAVGLPAAVHASRDQTRLDFC